MSLKFLTLWNYNVTGKVKLSLHKPQKDKGNGEIVPLIRKFCMRYGKEVSLTPRPLYSQERIPRCPFHSRHRMPQSRSGYFGEGEEKLCPSQFEPSINQPTA